MRLSTENRRQTLSASDEGVRTAAEMTLASLVGRRPV
jgi:hypothetical protein